MATVRTTKTDPPADPQPPSEGEGGESLVDVVRREIGNALGSLLDSGKAKVTDSAETDEDAPRTWTARDIQAFAAEEMKRAQAELATKRQAKRQTQPPATTPEPPPASAPVEAPPRARRTLSEILWGPK